jgi:hypothetical protein
VWRGLRSPPISVRGYWPSRWVLVAGEIEQLMEADVTAACGSRGRHDPDRAATRHGSERSVTLGGRRVSVVRPRVSAADGSVELQVPAYEVFSSTDPRGRAARRGSWPLS